MRPLRLLLCLLSCIVTFCLLLALGPWRAKTVEEMDERKSIGAYFNWRTPSSSLFPPSAIISLTDDNSTFFLARPAAFGPALPTKSLSGQLWIGSGFGEHLGRGSSGAGAGAEGELGCSDVPGWTDYDYKPPGGSPRKSRTDAHRASLEDRMMDGGNSKSKRSSIVVDDAEDIEVDNHPTEDDGTDDHLHHPLQASNGLKTNGDSMRDTKKPVHADIQSLQEGAEIAGKIVLLSRGGCGFLEKVKWAQRRGGVALIVGDDIRGGQLVTMYARGDTSNITIPALFTSHTTAHLLSSLIPSGGSLVDFDEATRLGMALGEKTSTQDSREEEIAVDEGSASATTRTVGGTAATTSRPKQRAGQKKSFDQAQKTTTSHRSWLRYFFGHSTRDSADKARHPTESGKNGWVLQEDFEDIVPAKSNKDRQAETAFDSSKAPKSKSHQRKKDDFIIGVDDWRDPDLLSDHKSDGHEHLVVKGSSADTRIQKTKTSVKGGSITPGSGEYGRAANEPEKGERPHRSVTSADENQLRRFSRKWFRRFFNDDAESDDEVEHLALLQPLETTNAQETRSEGQRHRSQSQKDMLEQHQGLWITLTPTSMSSSPFFDTLLVLVVSPLVTLTVVYALLLLRSRIRRRRWRAPKSVVERLPVRTYQTMPSTTTTSPTTSSVSSLATVTTPLLQSSAPTSTRPRPRSRTTSQVAQSSSAQDDATCPPSLERIEEKRASGLAEWRRRYGRLQRECVVCLEEYIDGVSRVMSLPCGHEFHAECITPWLTTRRRTCPICKGDVVRSMAAASAPSVESQTHLEDVVLVDDADAIQDQAATTVNDDPASARPIATRDDEVFEDLERGVDVDRDR